MAKEAVFTLKLEAELRDAFMAEAANLHRPASQLVREFIRDFVKKQKADRAYEEWMTKDIEEGILEVDDPNTVWYDQEDLMKGRWLEQRNALLDRIAARDSAQDAEQKAGLKGVE